MYAKSFSSIHGTVIKKTCSRNKSDKITFKFAALGQADNLQPLHDQQTTQRFKPIINTGEYEDHIYFSSELTVSQIFTPAKLNSMTLCVRP